MPVQEGDLLPHACVTTFVRPKVAGLLRQVRVTTSALSRRTCRSTSRMSAISCALKAPTRCTASGRGRPLACESLASAGRGREPVAPASAVSVDARVDVAPTPPTASTLAHSSSIPVRASQLLQLSTRMQARLPAQLLSH